jgi:hypothetical protein
MRVLDQRIWRLQVKKMGMQVAPCNSACLVTPTGHRLCRGPHAQRSSATHAVASRRQAAHRTVMPRRPCCANRRRTGNSFPKCKCICRPNRTLAPTVARYRKPFIVTTRAAGGGGGTAAAAACPRRQAGRQSTWARWWGGRAHLRTCKQRRLCRRQLACQRSISKAAARRWPSLLRRTTRQQAQALYSCCIYDGMSLSLPVHI